VTSALAAHLEHLAEGDLTSAMTENVATGYQQLKDNYNRARETLRLALMAVAEANRSISGGAGEISTASDSMAHRTEQQAASLEQTATALDQINATLKRGSEGAEAVANSMSTAKNEAEKSGQTVLNAVEAMAKIATSSKKIAQIVGVIDEIAFQTNLLALNAGVEAARAGDAGRGFAVVASEVRALAQRCSQAAKEIKALITISAGDVDSSVSLVNEAGSALTSIVTTITKIDDLMRDMASSAREQATGLAEVNSAVNQMDQATQKNVAMVEETNAIAARLRSEVARMDDLLLRFELGEAANDRSIRDDEASKPQLRLLRKSARG